jgi:hypothetical protein
MTKPLPFTESHVRRAIAAVRKAGLEVSAVSVSPDGTVTVYQCPAGIALPARLNQTVPASEWEDIEA